MNQYFTISLTVQSDFCHLPITLANSLDSDRQNAGPNLDPNSLTLCVPESMKNYPACKKINETAPLEWLKTESSIRK